MHAPIATAYEKLMGFPTPPIVRGVGLTPMPSPERVYFWLGEPIDSRGSGAASDGSH